MGLTIHSIAELPHNIERGYYLYVLDYYSWDEPLSNTLKKNFNKIADFASRNNAVVIQGVPGSHFYSEVLSFDGINGEIAEEVLPAILITTIHPQYFLDRNDERSIGEDYPEDALVLIKIGEVCHTSPDVIKLLEKIFQDIQQEKKIADFEITKQLKKGIGGALVDALIAEPNVAGVGVDIKKLASVFNRIRNKS